MTSKQKQNRCPDGESDFHCQFLTVKNVHMWQFSLSSDIFHCQTIRIKPFGIKLFGIKPSDQTIFRENSMFWKVIWGVDRNNKYKDFIIKWCEFSVFILIRFLSLSPKLGLLMVNQMNFCISIICSLNKRKVIDVVFQIYFVNSPFIMSILKLWGKLWYKLYHMS